MPHGMPAAMAKGAKSMRDNSSCPASTTGRSKWLSTVARPWPGMCLITGATPPAISPAHAAKPNAPTMLGSAENARSPMAPVVSGRATSNTGAHATEIPKSRNSSAISRWFT